MSEVLLSIVVPVRGDVEPLGRLLETLPSHPRLQIIVAATAEDRGPVIRGDVEWVSGAAGRGTQLNTGASRAVGRWVWFVHADCQAPDGVLETFEVLDRELDVVGGAFRFALDSPVWQARLWERGVALRVRLFGLPYGDQGIFVRREVFDRMGGFRPMPLMEDVDFVGRLNRQGRVRHLKQRLVTSARRWQDEGWWRRSSRNLALLALYYVGVPPERLAQWYERVKG